MHDASIIVTAEAACAVLDSRTAVAGVPDSRHCRRPSRRVVRRRDRWPLRVLEVAATWRAV